MKLRYIRQAVAEGRYELSSHAIDMMVERGINIGDIRNAIYFGQVIDVNPEAKPFPTTILLGPTEISGDDIHIVFSKPSNSNTVTVVTVYYPDEVLWYKGKIRKRKKK